MKLATTAVMSLAVIIALSGPAGRAGAATDLVEKPVPTPQLQVTCTPGPYSPAFTWPTWGNASMPLAPLTSITAGDPPDSSVLGAFTLLMQNVVPPTCTISPLTPSSGADASADSVGAMTWNPIGWVLSGASLGWSIYSDLMAQSQRTQLINGLNQLNGTMANIEAEIAALQNQISTEIAEAECQLSTSGAYAALASIQSAQQNYADLVAAASVSQNPSAPMGSPTAKTGMAGWASAYIDPLQTALNDLNDSLLGTPGAPGSIASCAAQMATATQPNGVAWESSYYTNLYYYVTYWYAQQLTALNLYVEAATTLATYYLLDGLVTSGSQQLVLTEPQAACAPNVIQQATALQSKAGQQQPSAQFVQAYCTEAATMAAQVYYNLATQLLTAGAPYSWGNLVQSSGTSALVASQLTSSSVSRNEPVSLWTVDINDFQASGCTLPLTSTSTPCGGTVGDMASGATFSDDTAFGYSGWGAASSGDWYGMLDTGANVGSMVAGIMAAKGLGDSSHGSGQGLTDLIIYTGETHPLQADLFLGGAAQYGTGQNATLACFMDTGFIVVVGSQQYPMCGDGYNAGNVIDYMQADKTGSNQWWSQWAAGTNGFWYTDADFYDFAGYLNEDWAGNPWYVPTMPSFWVTGPCSTAKNSASTTTCAGTPPVEYRWPITAISTTDCVANPAANPAWGQSGPPSTLPLYNASPQLNGWVPTMCGNDMLAWVADQLPTPPATS